MSDEERRKWLDSLKQGDVVLLREGVVGDCEWSECVIEVANDGYLGTSRLVFPRDNGEGEWAAIFPANDDDARSEYERQKLRVHLERLWGKANEHEGLPIAKVRKLLAILEEKEECQ